jgi:F0F1-type ATP synthase assembly protein I
VFFVDGHRDPPPMVSFRKSDANMMRTAWELSAGLFSFIVAIGIGYWVGGALDARLGTAPWLLATFLALGLVAGVLNVYRTVSRAVWPSSGDRSGQARGPHD